MNLICFYITIILYIASVYFICILNLNYYVLDNIIEYINIITNISLIYSFDGITKLFIYLTTLIYVLIFLYNFNLKKNIFIYNILLLCMEVLCLIAFTVSNLLLFYIAFETILIPLFITIAINGFRNRKIHAAYLLYFYTLIGSILFLLAIIILYYYIGNSYVLLYNNIQFNIQIIIWCCLFISFSTKLPMCPLHIWLPEAHVESPTEISVLLAGILLKLGGYGLYKFNFCLFPQLNHYFASCIIMFGLFSILYISFIMMRQIDAKKIIAYSSILHMNLSLIGFYLFDPIILSGTLLSMIAHGFVSSGLFFIIGILYIRLKTKLLIYYNGLILLYPLLALYTFLFILSNISFPGTINFISEFFLLYSFSIINNTYYIIIILISLLNGSAVNIWFYVKIFFGEWSVQSNKNNEITIHDYNILFILIIHVIITGLFPTSLLTLIEFAISYNITNQFYILF